MSTLRRFEGRVAVVFGGNSGIGLATAHRLHTEGAHVLIGARRESEGRAGAAAVGGATMFQRVDVRERGQIDDLLELAMTTYGRLDVVVNSAGSSVVQPTMTLEARHWQRTLDVNLTGVFHACQSAIPHMRATIAAGLAKQTSVVTVASIDAVAADKGFAAYCAAKAGALNFTRSLALEYAAEGIRFNAVSPGLIATPMADLAQASPTAIAAYHHAIPIRRMGLPDEIAAAIAFVASDDASFMIGSNLVIDGGVTAGTGHPDILALFPR